MSAAEPRSAEASAKAEGFRLEIERAVRGTAEANRKAEEEHLARVKIEEQLADRVFTDDQRAKFISALSGKPKFPIQISCPDGEPVRYARQIILAFAGWDVRSDGVGVSTLRLSPDVESEIQKNLPGGAPIITWGGKDSDFSHAELLANAFFAAGIKTVSVRLTQEETPFTSIFIPLKSPR